MTELRELEAAVGPILAVKLYRLALDPPLHVPTLPCLDHEAMLHQTVPPHAAAYLQDRESGDIHEVVLVPAKRFVEIDTVSTWGESTPAACDRLVGIIRSRLPGWNLHVKGPSWWRGERRVAEACRAQVKLRDVLLSDDLAAVKYDIDRLQTVGNLMEKQSRVASWGVRTVTGPLLAAAGVLSFLLLGGFQDALGASGVTWLRYTALTLLGAVFLYYGLKAVQLTDMSNRVWKRSAEYNLILAERRRLRHQ